jgi:hypothetical protein
MSSRRLGDRRGGDAALGPNEDREEEAIDSVPLGKETLLCRGADARWR